MKKHLKYLLFSAPTNHFPLRWVPITKLPTAVNSEKQNFGCLLRDIIAKVLS